MELEIVEYFYQEQKKYYEQLRKKLVMQITGEQITAINAAVAMSKLLQISAGAVYTDDSDVLEFDISHRYKVLREVIDESSQKILIFVPSINPSLSTVVSSISPHP